MSLMLQKKKEAVDKLKKIASESTSIMIADYRGLKSSDMTELRAQLRQVEGVHLQIVRNTLAKRAFSNTSYEVIINYLRGPVVLAFINAEASSAAKIFRDFAKGKEKLSVKALVVEGNLLPGNQLDAIANLPTKQEVLTKLVITIKAPVVKFVRTLAEPTAKLVRTVQAIAEKNNK
jgi:large subunit ribosomal protein L10